MGSYFVSGLQWDGKNLFLDTTDISPDIIEDADEEISKYSYLTDEPIDNGYDKLEPTKEVIYIEKEPQIIEKTKYEIMWKPLLISILVCIISLICLCCSVKSCQDYKQNGEQNIKALTDTIHYYKAKNGELVATKELLYGDISVLKVANDSLYRVIKNMKLKDPSTVVYVKTEIENVKRDTVWKYQIDSIENHLEVIKQFAFNDDFRTLEGIVSVSDTTIGLNIEKDKVYCDYTLAVEGSKVYLKSNNPYVKFNEISGITIPSPKKKHWGVTIGPSVWYGYDFVAKKPGYGVGASVTLGWTPIRF